MMTIACIGAGNMGTALVKGVPAGTRIGFADADGAKAEEAAAKTGALVFASNTEAAVRGDFIFLAVKPQALATVLEEIAPVIRERAASGGVPVLVSMAAGWTLGRIQAALFTPETAALSAPEKSAPKPGAAPLVPIARIMPNTPALVSRGMIAYCTTPEFPSSKHEELKTILKGAGIIDWLDERYMDAVTGLSGSGPAFVYQFIEAMSDGGVLAGLPRDKALLYAAQTVLGAAAMVLETGKHPGELKDMVTSPGGTTIRGVAVLEQSGFRGAVISAVEAAWRRARELGAQK